MELEQAVSLLSDPARANAVWDLRGKYSFPKAVLEQTTEHYLRTDTIRAATLAREMGAHDLALDLYLENGYMLHTDEVAAVAEAAGLPDVGERVLKRWLYEAQEKKDYVSASRLARQLGEKDLATEMFFIGMGPMAAVIAKHLGLPELATKLGRHHIEQLRRTGMFDAEYAEEAGLYEEAMHQYEQTARFEDAARVARQLGMHDRAQAYAVLQSTRFQNSEE